MNDKELLELAAKAVGIELSESDHGDLLRVYFTDPHNGLCRYTAWNPLVDDGDAFRLMIKINLGITVLGDYLMENEQVIRVPATYVSAHINIPYFHKDDPSMVMSHVDVEENHDSDACSATRRAIVRAAAELQLKREARK